MLSARDLLRLHGVHEDLVAVVRRAHDFMPADLGFIVTEGLRSAERQAQLVRVGASRTHNSRHLTGHAVDLAVTLHGEVR
jgi:peptidoglycan L-alanyl-D-glutamate endopeptidase CwlK